MPFITGFPPIQQLLFDTANSFAEYGLTFACATDLYVTDLYASDLYMTDLCSSELWAGRSPERNRKRPSTAEANSY
jgi:hypothetical protein